MTLQFNKFTFVTKLSLVLLIVVGNIVSGFTSSSFEGQRSGWSGGGKFLSNKLKNVEHLGL